MALRLLTNRAILISITFGLIAYLSGNHVGPYIASLANSLCVHWAAIAMHLEKDYQALRRSRRWQRLMLHWLGILLVSYAMMPVLDRTSTTGWDSLLGVLAMSMGIFRAILTLVDEEIVLNPGILLY